ncbi:hypothetical protein TrST_g999 [Triparma strigata]|uniref:Uncharacterized protein n=1 Tax=Triparma strigata TaxID=1606541 RepID=A0A9W6ZW00_9STRA|nr:hypothetical protein TrST_g999 [Triparma strigata]
MKNIIAIAMVMMVAHSHALSIPDTTLHRRDALRAVLGGGAFAIMSPALAGEADAKKVEDSLAATVEKDAKEAAKEAMRLRIEASKKNYRPASSLGFLDARYGGGDKGKKEESSSGGNPGGLFEDL